MLRHRGWAEGEGDLRRGQWPDLHLRRRAFLDPRDVRGDRPTLLRAPEGPHAVLDPLREDVQTALLHLQLMEPRAFQAARGRRVGLPNEARGAVRATTGAWQVQVEEGAEAEGAAGVRVEVHLIERMSSGSQEINKSSSVHRVAGL